MHPKILLLEVGHCIHTFHHHLSRTLVLDHRVVQHHCVLHYQIKYSLLLLFFHCSCPTLAFYLFVSSGNRLWQSLDWALNHAREIMCGVDLG